MTWNKVHGPVAATLATCARIGWVVENVTTLMTHTGSVLELEVDPR